MWGGKSSARTFFARFFDKEKVKKEEPEIHYQRKRSQSMFAPNVSALMSGDHVGGARGTRSSLSTDQVIPVNLNIREVVGDRWDRDIEAVHGEDDKEDAEVDGEMDLQYLQLDFGRINQRRATDFSQADNDIRHFLAARKLKTLGDSTGSPAEQNEVQTPALDGGRRDMVFHKRVYGSVEALDGTEATKEEMNNRRFRIEASENIQEGADIPSTPVIENPEHQTKWYYKYFLGKLHQSLIGQDINKQVYILSVLQEKSYGKVQYRAILWTKEGPKRLRFRATSKSMTIKQILSHFGQLVKLEKLPREVVSPNIQKDLLWLEKQEGSMNFKFGVIFAKAGQIMDDELFSNETGSQKFEDFLQLLGETVQLKGWSKYKGGLDVRGNMTGLESVYTTYEEHEIMFHVSTLLPYRQEDRQQVERKRHIGNDIINIIFVDGDRGDMDRFKPVFIKSQFTHVYLVVCYETETASYHLTVYSEKSVPLFGPSLPANNRGFTNYQAFRHFLLVKCINGEKATYNTEVFATKRERTFSLLLEEAFSQYSGEESKSLSNRRFIQENRDENCRGYTNRRREDSRRDVFVKVGQSVKLENTLNSELGVLTTNTPSLNRKNSAANLRESAVSQGAPWEPSCVFSSLQMDITAGDLWAGVGVLVAAKEGGWILRHNKEAEKVFSLTSIVQLDIMETLGIIIFRTEKTGTKEQGQVWVYRLSGLEEATSTLGREEMKEHGLESSKGCSFYSVSRAEHSSLRLAILLGKRLLLYRWLHAEEWITFSSDTAEGFELVRELNLSEQLLTVTLVEYPTDCGENSSPQALAVVGSKRGFEIVNEGTGESQQVLGLEPGDSPRLTLEVWEDCQLELLVTFSCTSVFLREEEGQWCRSREVNWNCQPVTIVPAFPYLLGLSADTIEIRSPLNGSLLQTMNLPRLRLISIKDDIYFTSTKQGYNLRKNSEMEPMSKFCDPTRHLYKISSAGLVGHRADRQQSSFESCFSRTDSHSSYQSQSSQHDSSSTNSPVWGSPWDNKRGGIK